MGSGPQLNFSPQLGPAALRPGPLQDMGEKEDGRSYVTL